MFINFSVKNLKNISFSLEYSISYYSKKFKIILFLIWTLNRVSYSRKFNELKIIWEIDKYIMIKFSSWKLSLKMYFLFTTSEIINYFKCAKKCVNLGFLSGNSFCCRFWIEKKLSKNVHYSNSAEFNSKIDLMINSITEFDFNW